MSKTNKTEYKPNYAVHPIETLKEAAIYQDLGAEWVARIEKDGLTEKDIPMLSALYQIPQGFLRNLQGNYDEAVKRLEKKKAPNWMDCNCECHGFGDTNSPCPHCEPGKFPNYEVKDDIICKHCDLPIRIGANNPVCDHLYYPDNCDFCRNSNK